MCKIMVVANQKGGVAKTSTVRNLSYSLAKLGQRVLAVDFDGQFNLTTCFGIENPNELEHTIATLMTRLMNDEEIPAKDEYILKVGNVDLIPSSIQLSVVDANLRLEMGSDRLLSCLLDPLSRRFCFWLKAIHARLSLLTAHSMQTIKELAKFFDLL
ncbi:MAG: hypothetical protein A2Y17_02175 [Clostridiales bacterium GWF2_38_85]|nr:MAG: hypothetical protein A2Y17_02175 [Clostridiales bacterium GWF2_38_85]HBL85111.1 hypothetical protein [Clostridiales bacterium]